MGKELFKVVVEKLRFIGKHREWRICPHRADRLDFIHGHGANIDLEVLKSITEGSQSLEDAFMVRRRNFFGDIW